MRRCGILPSARSCCRRLRRGTGKCFGRRHRRQKNGGVVAGNQFQPGVLQLVGVLELVDQNVVEAVLVVLAQDFVALQHFVATEHEFSKIDHAFALADFVVFASHSIMRRVCGSGALNTEARKPDSFAR